MALTGASEESHAPPALSLLHPIWLSGALLMLVGTLLALRPAPPPPQPAPVTLPLPPVTVIDARGSVYETEQRMNGAALMARWQPLIARASRRFHVPAAWLVAVMRQESGGRTMMAEGRKLVSRRGAVGLMQLMPGTYDEMRAQYRLGADPFDPHDNIFAAAAYLRWLHARYGFPAMFAAYNSGPGRFGDRRHPLPDETRAYVANIAHALGHGKKKRRAVLTAGAIAAGHNG